MMDGTVPLGMRRVDLSIEPPFRLGRTWVDPQAHEVTIADRPQRMQPQTIKVLIALHGRVGQVVTRDELADLCWDGRIVGEDVINRCISLLRRVADAGGFRIETVPRAGYRLIDKQAAGSERKHRWWALAAGAALIAGALAYLIIPAREDPGRNSETLTVAVLPIATQSNDPGLEDAATTIRGSISEALNNGGFPVSLVDASARRKPDLVVSGSISRTPAAIVLVTQIEATRDGVLLYSHNFPAANNADDVAEQASAFVASKLSWAARLILLDRRHPSDPGVTEKLLQQSGDGLQGYEVARALAAKAPNSVTVQLALAYQTALVLGDLPRDQRPAAVALGRQAAAAALRIAPEFGDVYAAWSLLHGAAPLAVSEDEGRKGLQVDPDSFYVPFLLSGLLDAVGRVDESLALAEQALANDPYDPAKVARVERLLEQVGDKRDADEQFDRAMRWWPNDRTIAFNRLLGLEARGDYGEVARLEAERPNVQFPLVRAAAAELFAARRAHDRGRALRACADDRLRGTNLSLCMTILADLGEADRSFAIAKMLYPPAYGRTAPESEAMWLDQPNAFAIAILSGRAAASMRRDPRFLALADSNGLLSYWRSGRMPDFCRTNVEPICAHLIARS